MPKAHSDYWFPAKKYGLGWGLPRRWQGYLVLVAYVALVLWGIVRFAPQHESARLLAYLIVVTLLLIAVMYAKGERPVRWRWGGR